jgi:hypothetical protein
MAIFDPPWPIRSKKSESAQKIKLVHWSQPMNQCAWKSIFKERAGAYFGRSSTAAP